MEEIKYFIDDRFEISENIKKMSREERQKEIIRLETENKEKHNNLKECKV